MLPDDDSEWEITGRKLLIWLVAIIIGWLIVYLLYKLFTQSLGWWAEVLT